MEAQIRVLTATIAITFLISGAQSKLQRVDEYKCGSVIHTTVDMSRDVNGRPRAHMISSS